MNKVTMDIKSAEGGKDAKLFMHDLYDAYTKMFDRYN